MRLIDADELHNALANFYDDIDENEDIVLSKGELLSYVDDHPTADAIPVTWIEQYYGEYSESKYALYCRDMVHEWRIENDIDNEMDSNFKKVTI